MRNKYYQKTLLLIKQFNVQIWTLNFWKLLMAVLSRRDGIQFVESHKPKCTNGLIYFHFRIIFCTRCQLSKYSSIQAKRWRTICATKSQMAKISSTYALFLLFWKSMPYTKQRLHIRNCCFSCRWKTASNFNILTSSRIFHLLPTIPFLKLPNLSLCVCGCVTEIFIFIHMKSSTIKA